MAVTHRKGNAQPTQIPKGSPRTSPHPDKPMELIIVRGTPVVDCAQEVFGLVAAVTPSFCVIQPSHGSSGYCVCPWRDIAVGHIQPMPTTLPRKAGRKDRLNYLATLLSELEGLRLAVGLTPRLRAAHEEVLRSLGCG
ncbi:MAG: hypothetical protein AAGB26_10860 [Planctomycetota bacterium]